MSLDSLAQARLCVLNHEPDELPEEVTPAALEPTG